MLSYNYFSIVDQLLRIIQRHECTYPIMIVFNRMIYYNPLFDS